MMEIFLLLGIGIAMSALPALIASSKGRSGAAWFALAFIGLLFAGIGWFLVLLASVVVSRPARRNMVSYEEQGS